MTWHILAVRFASTDAVVLSSSQNTVFAAWVSNCKGFQEAHPRQNCAVIGLKCLAVGKEKGLFLLPSPAKRFFVDGS